MSQEYSVQSELDADEWDAEFRRNQEKKVMSTDTKAPSAGAMRAAQLCLDYCGMDTPAWSRIYQQTWAEFIDRETHVAELVEALERMVHLYFSGANDPQESPGQYVKQAQDALRRFKEGL